MNLRDLNIKNIVFTDKYGTSYTIKSMREYPVYQHWQQVNITSKDDMDEIASRKEIYGEEAENLYYMIAEFNMPILFDSRFDTTNIRTLNIPLA